VLPVPAKGLGKVYFVAADGSPKWCSGVSVQAANRSVVATAGGCVYDPVADARVGKAVFVPDGTATVYVAKQSFTHYDWEVYEDGDRDFAFIAVHQGVRADRRALTGVGRLADQAGAQGFAWNQPVTLRVVLRGHPTGWPLRPWLTSFARGGLFDVTYPGTAAAIKGEELLGVRAANPFATSVGSAWLLNYDASRRTGYLAGVTLGVIPDTDGVAISVSPHFDSETYAVLQAAGGIEPGPIV
jgi:hypothetical protein